MDESHETLNAFVDGELSPHEMQRIAALVASRPDLEAYVRQQEELRAALKMEAVLRAPVPQRLLQAAQSAPASWHWLLRSKLACHPAQWALSMAAGALALGLVIGTVTRPANDITLSGGQLIAQGSLRQALDTILAAAGYDGRGPQIGLSFRDRSGSDCRTFNAGQTAGLACHSSGNWVVRAMAARSPEPSSSPYRMAGSELPEAIRQLVQESIVGAPYDAAAEARARAAGWSGRR